MKYVVLRNNVLIVEKRSHPPRDIEYWESNEECDHGCCYVILTDHDGTKIAVVDERKWADHLNLLAKREYELSK